MAAPGAPAPFVIFTTILGQTDRLKAPAVRRWGTAISQLRFVCFTDRDDLICPPYEMVRIDPSPLGPQLTSRMIKICADHPALGSPQISLWHDAAFQLTVDPRVAVRQALAGADMLALRHPHRDRIEDEADACARLGFAPRAVLEAQVAAYRATGWVDQSRITSTGYCLRRHSPAMTAFNQRWWAEVALWTYRDQLSVDYALSLHPTVRVAYLTGHYRRNPYAKWFAW